MAISDTRKQFNKMFREARAAGKKTFEFDGKKYTTELTKPKADEKKEPPVKLEAEKLATSKDGKYDPELANRISVARQAMFDRESEEGRYGTMAKGGKVKAYAKGGSVSSASKRADGCITKGKTKGRMV